MKTGKIYLSTHLHIYLPTHLPEEGQEIRDGDLEVDHGGNLSVVKTNLPIYLPTYSSTYLPEEGQEIRNGDLEVNHGSDLSVVKPGEANGRPEPVGVPVYY